jgi:hypothetical protein
MSDGRQPTAGLTHHPMQQDQLRLAQAEFEERIHPGTPANVLMSDEKHRIVQP